MFSLTGRYIILTRSGVSKTVKPVSMSTHNSDLVSRGHSLRSKSGGALMLRCFTIAVFTCKPWNLCISAEAAKDLNKAVKAAELV